MASTFSGNSSGADGGAIDNGDGSTGTLTVSGSTFWGTLPTPVAPSATETATAGPGPSPCRAPRSRQHRHDGGAIDNGDSGTGTFSVSGSTFSGNTAHSSGGAIDDGDGGGTGVLTVSASTFSGNSATGKNSYQGPYGNPTANNGDGGAIAIGDNDGSGTVSVWASTFSANTARKGGDVIADAVNGGTGTVWAAADIFNGPCAAMGTWNDEGYNVGSNGTCQKAVPGDVSHGANLLGPLAHNGGPTETMLALAANPALGAVPLNTTVRLNGRSVTLCPATDQRGVHSAAGKACNAGAVQSAS